jgi:hypothetical protein
MSSVWVGMLRSGILIPIAMVIVVIILVAAFGIFQSSGIPNSAGSAALGSAATNMNSMLAAMAVMVVGGITLVAMGRKW